VRNEMSIAMSSRLVGLVLAVAVALSALAMVPGAGSGAQAARGPESGLLASAPAAEAHEGRYIVVLNVDRARAPELIQSLRRSERFSVDHEYRNVLPGFSARLTPQQVDRLSRRGEIAAIYPDVTVTTMQQIPAGIEAVGATENQTANINGVDERVDVDIAILDTGIRASHLDLNYQGGTTCIGGNPAQDLNGHGTHVAGTAAAIDNSIGVVGMAPGARLWSVKVMSDDGTGSLATIICGIDWVAERASTIDVVNMSLGAEMVVGAPDPLREPIRRLVEDYGVSVVVAAGNSGVRADAYEGLRCTFFFFGRCRSWETVTLHAIPAAYPETITVGAMNVSNNQRASFSNHGPAVDIYAPGVSVLSTTSTSNTSVGSLNGTSMATPHVAGAVALYKAVNPNATVGEIRQALNDHGINHGAYDAYNQPLLHVAGFAPPVPPDPVFDLAVTGINAPSTIFAGEPANVTVSVANTGNQDLNDVSVTLSADSTQVGTTQNVSISAGQTAQVSFEWTPAADGSVTLTGSANYDDGTNTASGSLDTNVNVANRVHDVAITSISASPNTFTQGESTSVSVTVRNNGTQAENVSVALDISPVGQIGIPAAQQQSINPGASRTFAFTLQTSESTAAQGYTVNAEATISGHADANPGDNTASTTLTVNEKPPFVTVFVEEITGSGSRGFFVHTVRGQIHIKDVAGGDVSGANVTVEITAPRTNTQTVNTTTGSNGWASFSVSVLQRGTYTLRVVNVDAGDNPYDPSLNKQTTHQVVVP
jgi:subtilisin